MIVTLLLLFLIGVVIFVVQRGRASGGVRQDVGSSSGDGDGGFAGAGDQRDEHHDHGSQPDRGSHDGGHDGDGGGGGGGGGGDGGSDGGGSDGGSDGGGSGD